MAILIFTNAEPMCRLKVMMITKVVYSHHSEFQTCNVTK